MTKILTMKEAMQALIDGKKITTTTTHANWCKYLNKDGNLFVKFDDEIKARPHANLSSYEKYIIYEEPIEYFDLNTAMGKVVEGHKVRKKSWQDSEYIFCTEWDNIKFEDEDSEEDGEYYILNKEDYHATDFYIKKGE